MKQFLAIVGIIAAAAAIAVAVLHFLPSSGVIREDFTCEN